jgi:hypothetical protein
LAIYVAFLFVFNNFSGSFFKKGILFLFLALKTGGKRPQFVPHCALLMIAGFVWLRHKNRRPQARG